MVFRPFRCVLKNRHVAVIQYLIAATVSLCFLSKSDSYAAEAWVDPNMLVRDGLELWLDAARALGDQPVLVDGNLSQWRDASGKNRNVRPPNANARPLLLKIGNAAVVRFDGIDDQLRAVKLGAKFDSF